MKAIERMWPPINLQSWIRTNGGSSLPSLSLECMFCHHSHSGALCKDIALRVMRVVRPTRRYMWLDPGKASKLLRFWRAGAKLFSSYNHPRHVSQVVVFLIKPATYQSGIVGHLFQSLLNLCVWGQSAN